MAFPACGQLAWAALELGQRLEVGGGGQEEGGGSYGGGTAATCETQVSCSARRAALVLSAGGKIAALLPPCCSHSWKARGSSSSLLACPTTTSHPRSTETRDCQSGGGVAAISSKNIFRLVKDKARIYLVLLKADFVLSTHSIFYV